MTAAPRHARNRLPGRRLAWIPILGLGLAACAGGVGPIDRLGWIEASSPKRLEVDQATYRHSVYFETDRAELTGAQRDRLLAFLASAQPADGDVLRIEGHADERATDLYNLELASRRIQTVASFLREQGYGGVEVTTAAYGEAAPAVAGAGPDAWQRNRRAELILERHLVTLPACPDWSRQSGTDFANLPHSNHGCATQSNLGLMIAEPRDLVRGRGLAPADGTHQAEAILRYRTDKVKQPVAEEVAK